MDIRVAMSMGIVMRQLTLEPLGGAVADFPFTAKEVEGYLNRLAWCPPVHKHFDQVSGAGVKFGVVHLATQDAKAFAEWTYEYYDPRAKGSKT